MKQIVAFDTEVYENYFLAMFKNPRTGTVAAFELYEGHDLDRENLHKVLALYTLVTFNGIKFDHPVLSLAMRKGVTCAQIKHLANTIIEQNLSPWQIKNVLSPEYSPTLLTSTDIIDLSEPVPGVMVSLKLYGARMHSKRLQDLPIHHTALIEPGQRELIRRYCENDLDTTLDLWNAATNPKDDIIATRVALTKEFGIDMRSKSDAQIAEAMIRSSVELKTGAPVFRPNIDPGTTYKFKPAPFLAFKTPTLQEVFRDVLAADFVVDHNGKVELPEALKRTIKIGGSAYNMGIGGLHSTESRAAHISTAHMRLYDRDVVSYYPSLILKCGLFPKNMGQHFQTVYKDFFDRRIAAKKSGNKSVAQTLKIVLNGTFGKLGSPYSVLYSPDLMIQVTVTGQLAILMLIERMEAAGIPVVSANTDGIVMACPAALEQAMLQIVAQWEVDTGLETEETRYRALFSRDVNGYLALKVGGGYKTKNCTSVGGLNKNPDADIVPLAVCEFLDKGTPLAQTILGCTDIRKFLRVRTANGGANWGDQYLGRVARWYRSTRSSTPITTVKKGDKVAGSDNAQPVMELTDTFPDDVDYAFYLQEANDLLVDIGAAPTPVPKVRTYKKLPEKIASLTTSQETLDLERDEARLDQQREAVWNLMRDGTWRTLAAISAEVGAPEASVSARLRDFRKVKYGKHTVEREYVSNGLWRYRVTTGVVHA